MRLLRTHGCAVSDMPARTRKLTADTRVSIVIPTLNEARNISHVLDALPQGVYEVILVDGNSTDETVTVARECRPDIRVVEQTRVGKGNALACGFHEAAGDIIVMIDADGSHDPQEIPRFVSALQSADLVTGSRFLPVATSGSSDITRLRRVGNAVLNGIANGLFRTSHSDLCYGYAAFWRDCMPCFHLDPSMQPGEQSIDRRWGDGFEIETLISIRAAKARLRVTEVASYEHHRLYGRSNLNAIFDGLRVMRTIVRERFNEPTVIMIPDLGAEYQLG